MSACFDVKQLRTRWVWALPRVTSVASLVCLCASSLPAQMVLRPGTSIFAAPTWQRWSFGDGVVLDSLTVRGATQLSMPFSVQTPLGDRASASLTGAVFSSALDVGSIVSTRSSAAVAPGLSGVTDLRLRVSTRLPGEALQLTAGLNIPTGPVALSGPQNQVVQVLGAPALDAQVSVPGLGLGGTLGVVYAREVGTWAWAFGASAERRGRYSPVDASIAGRTLRTELEPGMAMHLSIGADGLVNGSRVSVGVVTDVYGTDRIRLVTGGSGATPGDAYQLGPSLTATARAQIPARVLRDLTVRAAARYRSAFSLVGAGTVDGSSGSGVDLSISGLRGQAGRPSLLLGLDVRSQTQLAINDAFIGAGLAAVGATVGMSIPAGLVEWRPALRISAGKLTTTRATRDLTSIAIGVTAYAR